MTRSLSLLALPLLLLAPPLVAQDQTQQEDDESLDQIIVTGSMRVRQGGAQDVRHFRDMAEREGIPRPESLTMEGLLGEHDLSLPATKACARLFCLVAEAMPAALPLRPDDRLFVGLGFASNIEAKDWKREPLNLVAVVDKSGSMDGEPLDRVRESLTRIAGQLRAGDQLSIVLYGDESHVHLAPTPVSSGRDRILAAIRGIASAGSTNMEAGLRVGYDTAFASAPGFKGNTRVMLFTDEQPNVGATDADSFMGMARAAAERGIGLTTIGVGVQFDGALAARIASARGGNLFFVASADEVKTVFDKQLDTMVSEVAHDVRITMTPRAGYQVSGVFGVPDALMTSGKDGALTITVPTAFLSTNGGGIFASLAKSGDLAFLPAATADDGAPLMRVELSYVGAKDGVAGSDRLAVSGPSDRTSATLRKAQLLVDEYLVLKDATTAYHGANDAKKAHALLAGLDARLAGAPGLDGERKLVGTMLREAAVFAGYGGELPKGLRHRGVIGTWQITSARGFDDLARGDRLRFTDDREMLTFHKKTGFADESDAEAYQINESKIHLTESRLVLDYALDGDRLTMSIRDGLALSRVTMERVAEAETAS